jgi:hypothetical protein
VRRSAVLLLTLALVAAAACGDGRPRPDPSPTPTSSPTATPTATPLPGDGAIRDVDFTDPSVIAPVINALGGGEPNPLRTAFADFTGDGAEDAVVIIESGGTLGDLGAALFTLDAGRPRLLGVVEHGGKVEVRAAETGRGLIVSLTGVYAAGDAQCCPSRLRERVYQWAGDGLALLTDQEIPNPAR